MKFATKLEWIISQTFYGIMCNSSKDFLGNISECFTCT